MSLVVIQWTWQLHKKEFIDDLVAGVNGVIVEGGGGGEGVATWDDVTTNRGYVMLVFFSG